MGDSTKTIDSEYEKARIGSNASSSHCRVGAAQTVQVAGLPLPRAQSNSPDAVVARGTSEPNSESRWPRACAVVA
eukprot:3941537-Rhodomonas_salina.7